MIVKNLLDANLERADLSAAEAAEETRDVGNERDNRGIVYLWHNGYADLLAEIGIEVGNYGELRYNAAVYDRGADEYTGLLCVFGGLLETADRYSERDIPDWQRDVAAEALDAAGQFWVESDQDIQRLRDAIRKLEVILSAL